MFNARTVQAAGVCRLQRQFLCACLVKSNTCYSQDNTDLIGYQGGVSSQAGKVIFHFLITSKVNNCRSEKRCVFFCEQLLMWSVEIKRYMC